MSEITPPICTVDTCEQKRHARGYCSTHYHQWRGGRNVVEPVIEKLKTIVTPAKVRNGRPDFSQANCAGADTEIFMEFDLHRQARRVCFNCPVAPDCAFEAIRDDLEGTWGGIWFGGRYGGRYKTGSATRARMGIALIDYYRAVLCERLNVSRRFFINQYGDGLEGIRRALRTIQA